MDQDKSLLQQISEKEKTVCDRLEQVRIESEERILETRRDMEKKIGYAKEKSSSISDQLYTEESEKNRKDMEDLDKKGTKDAEKVRIEGEENLSRGVQVIIDRVILE